MSTESSPKDTLVWNLDDPPDKDNVERYSEAIGGYRSAAASWLVRGSAMGAIVLMPVGPLGFCIGGIMGGLLTVACGLFADWVRFELGKKEASIEKRRYEHLLRWSEFIFSDAEEPREIFLYTIQEFQAMSELASTNKTASSLMKRLGAFLRRVDVQNCAAEYVESFLLSWRDADAKEIATFESVLLVCTRAMHGSKRSPDVYKRMAAFANTSLIRVLFDQASSERSEMKGKALKGREWIAYADLGDQTVDDLFRAEFVQRFGLNRRRLASVGEDQPDRAHSSLEHLDGTPASIGAMHRSGGIAMPDKAPHPFIHSQSSIRVSTEINRAAVSSPSMSASVESSIAPPANVLSSEKSLVVSAETAHEDVDVSVPIKIRSQDEDESPPPSPVPCPAVPSPVERESSTSPVVVEPKPPSERIFFKSLEDLREFSPELKHKIPIGLYEFSFLDAHVPEDSRDKKWEFIGAKGDTRMYKQINTVNGSDLIMVKGYATLDVDVRTILWNIRDTPRRTKWDTTFDGFTLVEGNIQDNEIVFNSIKAPWPVADRGFLQWRRTIIDDKTGVVKILHRSAEHPAYPENVGSMIRAESIISAYILTPRGRDQCDLFLMTQTDIKGLIPRWMVNAAAAKAPFSWIENLRKACHETQGRDQPYNPRPLYLSGVPVGAH